MVCGDEDEAALRDLCEARGRSGWLEEHACRGGHMLWLLRKLTVDALRAQVVARVLQNTKTEGQAWAARREAWGTAMGSSLRPETSC